MANTINASSASALNSVIKSKQISKKYRFDYPIETYKMHFCLNNYLFKKKFLLTLKKKMWLCRLRKKIIKKGAWFLFTLNQQRNACMCIKSYKNSRNFKVKVCQMVEPSESPYPLKYSLRYSIPNREHFLCDCICHICSVFLITKYK